MISFYNKFNQIINLDECVSNNESWFAQCSQKTIGYIIIKLLMLILEIAWYNKYIIFAIVIFIIAFKVWQNKRQQQQRQQQQLQQ